MYAPKLNSKGQNFNALRDMPMNEKEIERQEAIRKNILEFIQNLREEYSGMTYGEHLEDLD